MTGLARALLDLTSLATNDNTRALGVLILYKRSGIMDERAAFVYQQRRSSDGSVRPPLRVGEFQTASSPLLVRCRIDTDLEVPELPIRRGVMICLAGVGESNLLVLIPYEGEDVRDLGAVQLGGAPN